MNEKLKARYESAKVDFDAQVGKMLLENPNKSYRQVASEFSISADWVISPPRACWAMPRLISGVGSVRSPKARMVWASWRR